MNKKQMTELAYKVITFAALYIGITLYTKLNAAYDFQNWYYIANIGGASIIYLIIFLGSDSVGYRLKDENQLKAKLEKLTISKKAILGHVIVIVISIILAILIDGLTS